MFQFILWAKLQTEPAQWLREIPTLPLKKALSSDSQRRSHRAACQAGLGPSLRPWPAIGQFPECPASRISISSTQPPETKAQTPKQVTSPHKTTRELSRENNIIIRNHACIYIS